MYYGACFAVAREEGEKKKKKAFSSFKGFDQVPEICVLLRLLLVTFQAFRKQVLFVKPLRDCHFVFLLFISF